MKKRWKVVLILVAVVCFAISLSYPLKYKMEEKSTEAGMEKLIAMRDAGMAKRGERGDGRQEATVEEAGEEGAGETEPQAESERPEGTAPSDSEGESEAEATEAESEPSEEAEATEASAPESEPGEEAEAAEPEAESEAAVAVRTEAEGEAPEAQAVMAAQETPVEAEEPQGAAATQEQPSEEVEAPSEEAEAAEPSEVAEPSKESEAAEPSKATEPSEATEPSDETEAAESAEASESAEVTVPSEAAKPGEEAEASESESAESDESGAEPETLPVAGAQGEGAAQVLPGKTRQPVPTMDYGPTPIPTPTSMPTATPSPTATPVPTPTPNRFERTGAEPYAQKVKRTLDESKILPQFQEIYAENKDFAGWITIPDTVIDYPVVQAEDSDYYLHHDFFGDKNANGQIILDTKCDPYTPSYNLVISGHSMRSGKMFGRLVNYMDESYWEKHKLVYFDTLMDERTYVVMAAFFSADYDVDETGFRYNADIQYSVEAKQWLREIEENELYDMGIDAEFGDEFLTLTTCNKAHRSDGRFVVVCRRLRAGEEIE